MTTLIPREPYTQEELARLYPQGLQLQLVQVVRSRQLTFQGTRAKANGYQYSSFAMVSYLSHESSFPELC